MKRQRNPNQETEDEIQFGLNPIQCNRPNEHRKSISSSVKQAFSHHSTFDKLFNRNNVKLKLQLHPLDVFHHFIPQLQITPGEADTPNTI